jgi:hypothetical protein
MVRVMVAAPAANRRLGRRRHAAGAVLVSALSGFSGQKGAGDQHSTLLNNAFCLRGNDEQEADGAYPPKAPAPATGAHSGS